MFLSKWMRGASLLGIVFFLAIFIIKPIGVSTQFSVLTGIIHNLIDPTIIMEDSSRETGYKSTNAYYDKSEGKIASEIKNPINYDFVFVLAIPVGAYLGYKINSKKKQSESLIYENTDEIKPNKVSLATYLPNFIGGFLILYGARMSDGCTSGHMMSGIMQGSISGYIFAISAFVIAIPTAIITSKRSVLKGVN